MVIPNTINSELLVHLYTENAKKTVFLRMKSSRKNDGQKNCEKSSPKIDLKKKHTEKCTKKISELVKQAENTIRSVQYKVDDPCEPPNPPKILENNPCKEFPNVQQESHFLW